ncbi:MAG: L,D-transpeptidase family protein [Oligoflexales bacterium]
MSKFVFFIFQFSISISSFGHLVPKSSSQLLVVITNGWEDYEGKLSYCEHSDTDSVWKCSRKFDVVVGKNGMGWGRGIKKFNLDGPIKKEGDNKSPAGIFTLDTAFGHTNREYFQDLKMPYLELSESIEAVDDPDSQLYNRIVDREKVDINWKTSEKMGYEPLYLRGFVVNHNIYQTIRGFGSQIFLHIWNHSKTGTGGCTAMSFENINFLFNSLEKNRNPILVQLPKNIYLDLVKEGKLPKF